MLVRNPIRSLFYEPEALADFRLNDMWRSAIASGSKLQAFAWQKTKSLVTSAGISKIISIDKIRS